MYRHASSRLDWDHYIGHEQGVLSGCQNDVKNMHRYIKQVDCFPDRHTVVLMDDGHHKMPTRDNILAALQQLVEESEPGDALFVHYSGHGCRIRDTSGDEKDDFDEAIVPCDYE